MGLRPARTMRDLDKVAWTRYSRSKPRKSYIRSMPHRHLTRYRFGSDKSEYDRAYLLVATQDVMLRDNALESARQVINRYLDRTMQGNYFFMVRIYPHHIIRENKMVAGAGADRIQKGMRRAFGRPTMVAARVKKGTPIFEVRTFSSNEKDVGVAYKRARMKLSGRFRVDTLDLTNSKVSN